MVDRIKALCEERGITLAELERTLKIGNGVIARWRKSKPAYDRIAKVAAYFGVTPEYLISGDTEKNSSPDYSEEEKNLVKDYKALDRHGKNMVKIVITEEQKRMLEAQRKAVPDEPTRIIPLYYTPAAAGMTSPAAGEDFDYIEITGDAPRNADFAVKIDGDSMEPYITDGSIVYVNREPLENGDVGIWCVDGDMICKQYYRDDNGNVHLLSLNRNRSDADRFIHARDNDTMMAYYGRVILPRRPRISLA